MLQVVCSSKATRTETQMVYFQVNLLLLKACDCPTSKNSIIDRHERSFLTYFRHYRGQNSSSCFI
jgi:hypothetical protein